ncbi:UNVERIFIED_CONTAM: hypothetical protein Sindi_2020600 [Sesamum indicum]
MVIDAGDKEATTALCELKTKWEKRFGKEATTRCFRARSTTFDLPMARRQAWRSLRPPEFILNQNRNGGSKATDLMLTSFSGEKGGRKDAQTTDSGQEDDFRRVGVTSPADVIPAMTSPTDTCDEIIRDMRKTPIPMKDIPTPTGLFVEKSRCILIRIREVIVRPTMPERRVEKPMDRREVEETEMREIPKNAAGPSREERVMQPHESGFMLNLAIWNVRGLNKRDHQLTVKDIVAEFRLHFLGLLETRVRTNNITCFHSFLMPHWKWYVDPVSIGNRIWITLVGTLELSRILAIQCTDIPWLVGGDFNAIRDLSEVCGTSGDIRMAMDEFNTCLQNTALLPLPMQGEWYTWHNRSTSPCNLWKRLDRMLTNDTWTVRFRNVIYTCLTPRTSDHSPMVIIGDNHQQHGGMFRFDNFITHSLDFIPSVQSVWQHEIVGVPIFSITRKLKALKPIFRELKRKKGDLTNNVHLAKGFLEVAQTLVSANRQDELWLLLEHFCRLVYAKAAKFEQIMLQQRAKM